MPRGKSFKPSIDDLNQCKMTRFLIPRDVNADKRIAMAPQIASHHVNTNVGLYKFTAPPATEVVPLADSPEEKPRVCRKRKSDVLRNQDSASPEVVTLSDSSPASGGRVILRTSPRFSLPPIVLRDSNNRPSSSNSNSNSSNNHNVSESSDKENHNASKSSGKESCATHRKPDLLDFHSLSIDDKTEWKKYVIVPPPEDPNEEKIDIELAEHEDKTVSYWDQMAAEINAKKQSYKFDYIVTGDETGKYLLIKWTGFGLPSWIRNSHVDHGRGQMSVAHNKRTAAMALLEAQVRKEIEENKLGKFETLYPNRWLKREEGEGNGNYATSPRARFVNKLKVAEWRMNYEYEKVKVMAPVYVENWVDDTPFPDIKFITKSVPSPKVATILANTNELAFIKCCKCKAVCNYPRERLENVLPCCGIEYGSMFYYDNGKIETRRELVENSVVLTSVEIESMIVVECGPDCNCVITAAPKECKQRVVQKGRTCVLVIFREADERGWSLRAGEKIPKSAFVAEYVGEVLTGKEQEERTASHYLFGLRYGWAENIIRTTRVRNVKLKKGQTQIRHHRPFVVDASVMGNEARFINHSCEPNLAAAVVYVERHGEFYHRIAFFARREIAPGEELTFDYFPSGEEMDNARRMFPYCRCGTESCKFPNPVPQDLNESLCTNDSHSDYDDVDSFISDNEVLEQQQFIADEKEKKREEEEKRKKLSQSRRASMRLSGRTDLNNSLMEETSPVKSPPSPVHMLATNLRRDPAVILAERYHEEPEDSRKRIKGGILDMIDTNWSLKRQNEMFAEAEKMMKDREKERKEREKARANEGGDGTSK
ncbi:hypothetical protein PFISCL1PPCAC_25256 [Pristionchus fissidentatus]|uniref:SET domain-containing protein n=1 Tax=Pristionchus fissidentatus TaxID=1538716 RepID=A0AAV5WTE5_9BILA|nr:hypothetical protein PFISCL1PPCAC_25256 [Pristionchus fissidentatus]